MKENRSTSFYPRLLLYQPFCYHSYQLSGISYQMSVDSYLLSRCQPRTSCYPWVVTGPRFSSTPCGRWPHIILPVRGNLIPPLLQLETERVEDAVVAKLPPPSYRLPREKPAPKPKAMTKWEKYAKEKGLNRIEAQIGHSKSKTILNLHL